MLHDEPVLAPREEMAIVAFRDLRTERQIGVNGVGPIPWRAVAAWCDRYEVFEAEELIELVQTIDAEWLASGTTERPTNRGHTDNAPAEKRRGVVSGVRR
jgi:hypothetical protein